MTQLTNVPPAILVLDMSDETRVVHADPDIVGGTLVFVGTCVPVQSVFDCIEGADTLDEFLERSPSIRREQAIAALELARDMSCRRRSES